MKISNFCKSHLLEERDSHQVEGILHCLQNHLAETHSGLDQRLGLGSEDLVVVVPAGEALGHVIEVGADDRRIILAAGSGASKMYCSSR